MSDNKFQEEVHDVLQEIEDLLVAKNEKYGNSALEPLGVFSQLSAKEGLLVRIDDKLKRIKNGSLDNDDEDVINDLIGYLVLLKIHANREQSFDELDGSHNWEKISIPSSGNTFSTTTLNHMTSTNVDANGNPLGSNWSYTSSKPHNED
jgi:hypothetical protein